MKWPVQAKDIKYQTSLDSTYQHMMTYLSSSNKKRPLLVALHSWSGTYKQAGWQNDALQWCIENDWHFIHPNFRGPNTSKEACGSNKAVQDIIDAVTYISQNNKVDTERIYLMGSSGGGYMALLLAGRHPTIWAGVSAWVPIYDIHTWWQENDKHKKYSKYARDIERVLGGRLDQNKVARQQAKLRSPSHYLSNAQEVNIDISAGINDGRKGGSVPFDHSLRAFNKIVSPKVRIPEKLIVDFYQKQSLPTELPQARKDQLYGKKELIFRQNTKHTRVNIFKGGHEIIPHVALNWLKDQRKAKPAVWQPTSIFTLSKSTNKHESGL
jgi:alpha-beta hydrolase superfamily lysophospholipase